MNILILEDDAGSRDVLQQNLNQRGHQCRVFSSPSHAANTAGYQETDVVLSDIHMPGCRGVDHIREICEMKNPPIVIVMTGFPALETCLESLEIGVYGYLVKPFRVDDFVRLAERGLEERVLRNELVVLRKQVASLKAELKQAGNKVV
jgi:DNA-binding NtrC family response regulator